MSERAGRPHARERTCAQEPALSEHKAADVHVAIVSAVVIDVIDVPSVKAISRVEA